MDARDDQYVAGTCLKTATWSRSWTPGRYDRRASAVRRDEAERAQSALAQVKSASPRPRCRARSRGSSWQDPDGARTAGRRCQYSHLRGAARPWARGSSRAHHQERNGALLPLPVKDRAPAVGHVSACSSCRSGAVPCGRMCVWRTNRSLGKHRREGHNRAHLACSLGFGSFSTR